MRRPDRGSNESTESCHWFEPGILESTLLQPNFLQKAVDQCADRSRSRLCWQGILFLPNTLTWSIRPGYSWPYRTTTTAPNSNSNNPLFVCGQLFVIVRHAKRFIFSCLPPIALLRIHCTHKMPWATQAGKGRGNKVVGSFSQPASRPSSHKRPRHPTIESLRARSLWYHCRRHSSFNSQVLVQAVLRNRRFMSLLRTRYLFGSPGAAETPLNIAKPDIRSTL
ncbi:hypothetical protein BD410DRAFT_179953 [Rickenella mellea]|uniref:Uncharacterized protein n=1 Tax=Rickenella mellea TaxID=50990 RepID=A0A4Y7PGT5_9AGAM|nr:hypothetical protein BD410DRAFT_179953 [Rickenella mellea]